MTVIVLIAPFYSPVAQAAEFKVNCSSVDDCMTKGDKLTKKRKLSLITNTQLQLESLDDIKGLGIYSKKLTMPNNDF